MSQRVPTRPDSGILPEDAALAGRRGGRGGCGTAPPARRPLLLRCWLLPVLAALLRRGAAQELDLTFAYSTLDQDYLAVTPRPRPGVRQADASAAHLAPVRRPLTRAMTLRR